jgi:tetratricopeptide (TPR) repeat protein
LKLAGAICLVLLATFGALQGCARRDPRDDCGPSTRVVDQALLAFLSKARSAHHVADLAEAKADRSSALRALNDVVASPLPAASPEVDEVLADTHARIADLLSQAGRFDQAEAEITQGLDRARTATYFRGHLLEVRGLVEERREKSLRAGGRGQEADQARERSIAAYEEAMKLQAKVIGAAAPTPSGAAPKP